MNGVDLSQLFAFDKLLVNTTFSFAQILISLFITLIISLFIYFIYKKTYSGVLYSKNFNITLVMTALVVDALMIGISGNLILSLGLVGALSIVRFRTAIKDPKDTAYIFWAISIGVINGVQYYQLSILASIFIALVLLILSGTSTYETSYLLIIKYAPKSYQDIEKVLKNEFQKFFIRTDSMKEQVAEKVVEVRMKKGNQENSISQIRAIQGVQSCTLVTSNGEFAE